MAMVATIFLPLGRIRIGMSDHHQTENAGYDDNSELHPTCQPDWDTIEINCGGQDFVKALEELQADELENALIVIRGLMAWTYQNGSTNTEGKAIRGAILEWLVLPHLHPLNLTQIAKGYGKHKQSFGRWVDDFKRTFPTVKTCHMKNE
jgi:hypothetical protein